MKDDGGERRPAEARFARCPRRGPRVPKVWLDYISAEATGKLTESKTALTTAVRQRVTPVGKLPAFLFDRPRVGATVQ